MLSHKPNWQGKLAGKQAKCKCSYEEPSIEDSKIAPELHIGGRGGQLTGIVSRLTLTKLHLTIIITGTYVPSNASEILLQVVHKLS